MPIGEGFWLHVRGQWHGAWEHLSTVLDSPIRYGLSDIEVRQRQSEASDDHRRRVLVSVMKKGWIRVRSYAGYTVFEYWRLNRRVADAIFDFISDVLSAGMAAEYQLNEVSSGRTFTVTARDFYDQVEVQLAGASRGGETLFLLGRAMGQGRK